MTIPIILQNTKNTKYHTQNIENIKYKKHRKHRISQNIIHKISHIKSECRRRSLGGRRGAEPPTYMIIPTILTINATTDAK